MSQPILVRQMRKLNMNARQRWDTTDKASDQNSLCCKEVVKIDVENLAELDDRPSGGRYFSFCESLPNSCMGCMTSEDCTEDVER